MSTSSKKEYKMVLTKIARKDYIKVEGLIIIYIPKGYSYDYEVRFYYDDCIKFKPEVIEAPHLYEQISINEWLKYYNHPDAIK